MKRLLALILLLPLLAIGQVTTTPSTTGVPAPQSAVAITGGSINGTPIGATTASTGAFTTLSATKPTAGDVAIFTNGGGTPRTAFVYSDANNVGFFDAASAGGNGMLIGTSSNTISVQTGGVTRWASSSGTAMAVTGTISVSAIAASGAAQTGYLCYNTTGGVLTYDSGATCLVSREEYKTNLGRINGALSTVLKLRPFWGAYREGTPMGDHRVQPFLGARYTASVDDRLASFDKDGEPLGVRYENMTAVLVAAIQEQQKQINELKHEVRSLRATTAVHRVKY